MTKQQSILRILHCVLAAFCVNFAAQRQLCATERGLFAIGQNIANPQGALGINANPAGLAEGVATDLRLNASVGGGPFGVSRGNGWGAFGATPLGPLGLGVAIEHDGDGDGVASAPSWYSRSRLGIGTGLALGDRAFIGGAARWQIVAGGDTLQTWDLGLLLRPCRGFSLGARATAIGSDKRSADAFETHLGGGLALRPFGNDRLTAAFDVDLPVKAASHTATATISSRIANGLSVIVEGKDFAPEGAGAFTFDRHDLRVSAGIRFGFSSSGIDIGGHADRGRSAAASGDGWIPAVDVGLRWSGEERAGLGASGPASIEVKMTGAMSEHKEGQGRHFTSLLLYLQRVADLPDTSLIVLHVSQFSASWAQIEELRASIAQLRNRGKHVVFFSEDLATRAFAVAAACDKIVVPPAGTVSARGVGADFMGLQETLEKIGITVQALRYGDNKTAPEQYTNKLPSLPRVAQMEHVVQRQWHEFVEDVSLGRGLTPTAIEAAIARGAVYPADALDAHLIDAVADWRDIREQLQTWNYLAKGDDLVQWEPREKARQHWGYRPRIAILEIDGAIGDGDSGTSLTGRSVGGAELAKAIRSAADDSSTKAIIARIDSPGGTVYGSDLMYDSLKRAGAKLPVIASMSSVAASGGYWTSLGANTVFADRNTITGSIGIFALKPSAAGLLQKLGIGLTHVGAGPHHDITSMYRTWTAEEQQTLYQTLGRYYDLFLERTAARRKLDRATLPGLAEGRIWFGDEAKSRGLIDEQGGILAAIDAACKAAKLSDDDDIQITFTPQNGILAQFRLSLIGMLSETAPSGNQQALAMLQQAVGPWVDAALLQDWAKPNAALAILPETFGQSAR